MADVFRQQSTRWELAGKRVPAGTEGAVKVTVESRRWYGAVGGKHVPLSPDKAVAERLLRKKLADADLDQAGLADPFAAPARRPLADHLADYAAVLAAKGDTPDHVRQTADRIRAVLAGCGFVTAADLDVGRVSVWLAGRRRDGPGVPVPPGAAFTPARAAAVLGVSGAGLRAAIKRHGLPAHGHGMARRLPRETVERLAALQARGWSPETANHHVRAARGFTRWLVKTQRLRDDPLATLGLVGTAADVRRGRRELTADQLRAVLAAAGASRRSFRGLGGPARRALYLTAAATGFRASALAGLTPAEFDLVADPPTVTLPARLNKSRRPKVQPFPPEAVEVLGPILTGTPAGAAVWGGTWAKDHRGAEMLRGTWLRPASRTWCPARTGRSSPTSTH
ncbi:MAG: hypothetical protein U0871_01980 [Gemmataceae bacterium]